MKTASKTTIKELSPLLSLNASVKESAEDILNLVIGDSIITNKSIVRLDPLYDSLAAKNENEEDIIEKVYNSLPLNNNVIADIIKLCEENNRSILINNIMDQLKRIRRKEIGYILEKYLVDYENSVLNKIIKSFIYTFENMQSETDKIFDNIETGFKKNIISSLKVFFKTMVIIGNKTEV